MDANAIRFAGLKEDRVQEKLLRASEDLSAAQGAAAAVLFGASRTYREPGSNSSKAPRALQMPEAVLRRVAEALGVGYFNLMDWLGGFFKPTATKFKKVERFTACRWRHARAEVGM